MTVGRVPEKADLVIPVATGTTVLGFHSVCNLIFSLVVVRQSFVLIFVVSPQIDLKSGSQGQAVSTNSLVFLVYM